MIEAVYRAILPSAYADEHIAHYGKKELIDLFSRRGFKLEGTRYILRSELVLALRREPD